MWYRLFFVLNLAIPFLGWSLKRISAVQNLFINKQSCSALNQNWISTVHYLKISEQSCFRAVQLWNPSFPEQKISAEQRCFRADFLWISAGCLWISAVPQFLQSEKINWRIRSETHVFGTGNRWFSLRQSWSVVKLFDWRLLNLEQKQLFWLKLSLFGKKQSKIINLHK